MTKSRLAAAAVLAYQTRTVETTVHPTRDKASRTQVPPDDSSITRIRTDFFGWAMLIAVSTLIAYTPAYRAGFLWDDDDYVTQNPTLTADNGLARIWTEFGATPQYYPLVFTTFRLERALWGWNPAGYHAVNVALHVAAALLLMACLKTLDVPGAELAGLLFALHPAHVESVAWITERKNTLSAALAFASLLLYLRFDLRDDGTSDARTGPPEKGLHNRGRWTVYAASVALFVLAMLSKTVVASMPFAILLILWWKRGTVRAKDVGLLLPFVAVSVGLGLTTVWMEKNVVGAAGEEWTLTALDRAAIVGRAAWFYAGKLLLPINLSFVYPRWSIDGTQPAQFIAPALVVATIAILFIARNRIGRGPLVAVLIFGGTMLPAMGIFDVYPFRYSYVADHFQYFASAALLTLAGAGLSMACARLLSRNRGSEAPTRAAWPMAQSRPALTIGLAIAVLFGTLCYRRALAFVDRETIWKDVIAKNPSCWIAHNNLGLMLLLQGRLDEAETHLVAAEKHAVFDRDIARTQQNLGELAVERSQFETAIVHLERSIETVPTRSRPYVFAGIALAQLGRQHEAAASFARAIELDPANGLAHLNLGILLAQTGEMERATPLFEEAVRLNPNRIDALEALARARLTKGQAEEARKLLTRALSVEPDNQRIRAQLAALPDP